MGFTNQKLCASSYKLIKDVRTQQETAAVDDVLNGDIDRFLKAYLMTQQQNTNESPWEK